ncbi:MAG: transposase [Nitrospirae bacterium]|nr:transposase [Nitrospirota bacterium]
MNRGHGRNSCDEYKTWGKSRSNRFPNYDYSIDNPVHLAICTKDKKTIFSVENHAKVLIAELLKAVDDLKFIILCYCLMPDHIHIIISPGNSGLPLSKFLNIFKGRTAAVFRTSFGVSELWQRSGFDHVIRAEEDLKTIIKYILNNPVRKGIAETAESYPYSKWFEEKTKSYL